MYSGGRRESIVVVFGVVVGVEGGDKRVFESGLLDRSNQRE